MVIFFLQSLILYAEVLNFIKYQPIQLSGRYESQKNIINSSLKM